MLVLPAFYTLSCRAERFLDVDPRMDQQSGASHSFAHPVANAESTNIVDKLFFYGFLQKRIFLLNKIL